MLCFRAIPAVVIVSIAPCAWGQISPVTQERAVQTQVSLTSGSSDSDSAEAASFGPFTRTVTRTMAGAAGADATGAASQDSSLTSVLVTGVLGAHTAGHTGTTFVVGEADAQSTFLFIFDLTEATPVHFTAAVQLAFVGGNPDGEPSDLSGLASVRLLNGITEEPIAGAVLNGDSATGSDSLDATLPAGQYVILATARTHTYSADLLGPPPRSGSGHATVSFSLSVATGSCGTADFNCDGDIGTDQDIESFFACLAGSCPLAPCTNSADFNGDGDIGTDQDIEAFFRVLAGGSC